MNYCLLKRHCDVIGSNVETGFRKVNCISGLNIFKLKKSVGGHVKKFITSSFFNRITLFSVVKCRGFQ